DTPPIKNPIERVLIQSRISADASAKARTCASGSVAGACHRERRHIAGQGRIAGADNVRTKIAKTRCDWIGNSRDTGAHLNCLSSFIPPSKSKQKIDTPKNKEDKEYCDERRFNEYAPVLVA